jgi:rhodanese-related sulfurtransferase
MPVTEIDCHELSALLRSDEAPLLVDVREEGEAAICAIEGSLLIPMNSLPQRLQELPRDRRIALYCHHGVRSMMAAQFLAQYGFDALSLAGGIDRWAIDIDPAMARY